MIILPLNSLFNDSQEMRNLPYRAAHGSIIRTLVDLIKLRQAQAANHLLMSLGRGYKTPVILNPNLANAR